jgi:secondary thiamine-phosphate synthase enzyme
MSAYQHSFRISTQGHCDVIDITRQVAGAVSASKIRHGIVNVAGKGSTLGVTTIEYEPGAVSDLRRALDQIAPENDDYAHNARWGDHNGFAHLRSALIGTAASFPVRDGAVDIGTWQQIVLCDFDDRPRERRVMVTVVGE